MKKTLCISLGYEGGCLYYANRLLENLNVEKDVWISRWTDEPFVNYSKRLRIKGGLFNVLISSFFFLPVYIIKIICGIISNKWDKVIVFGPNIWDGIFLLLFRILGKKSYYIIHDGVLHSGEDDKFHQKLNNFNIRQATNHVFLSEYVSEMVKKRLNIRRKTQIIPHGIIIYNGSVRLKANNEENITFKRKRLLMIGRINRYKGVDLLFEAIRTLDFSKIDSITIAGKFEKCISIPDDIINHQKITIINKYLNDEEFNDLMIGHDIILMPYLEATQSGVAATSIGYLKPAIVTRVGAMEEQFGDSAVYMVDTSVVSLRDSIEYLLNNEDVYEDKIKKLQKKQKELNWESLGELLKNFINENNTSD